ncbi:hypothetical protein ACHQM5_007366 [Ranunculus cassubicifolius]
MALFSSPLPSSHLSTLSTKFSSKTHFSSQRPFLPLFSKKNLLSIKATVEGDVNSAVVAIEEKVVEVASAVKEVIEEKAKPKIESNGVALAAAVKEEGVLKYENPKWVGGTWDLKQFNKDGKTDWDAVIDAEVRRRKWLEMNPESSNNDEPVVFDTSIIPWWSWVKRFHLPEAEKLNGRAAMIGFFMAYFVDSLTGVGLVDQMGNFFCKTLLFVSVLGVLFIRKNEDVENLKNLFNETTLYDKQWQATWKEDDVKKD